MVYPNLTLNVDGDTELLASVIEIKMKTFFTKTYWHFP